MSKKLLNINTKYIFMFFILIIIVSCKKSDKYINEYPLAETIKRSTKIVIELHKKLETKSGTTFPVESKVCEVTDKNQILHFEQVFKNGKHTGYCCCPDVNYSIYFYQNDENEYFALYHIDTIEFNNKARIFEDSFQYSYIVDKKKLKDYLEETGK